MVASVAPPTSSLVLSHSAACRYFADLAAKASANSKVSSSQPVVATHS